MKEPSSRARPVVAIDGPAGAGKSTVAAFLARRFGLLNLETGAMYRALALKAMQTNTDPENESHLLRLVLETKIVLEAELEGNQVFLDGETVTARLREPEVTAMASRVSVHPQVRRWMVEQQRLLGSGGGVVMEGRDIGTVVFPDAEVKIFLDAAPEVRGVRRFQQTGQVEGEASQAEVLRELRERDTRDRNRAESPLRPAEDAITIDSSNLSLEQVLEVAERVVAERYGPLPQPGPQGKAAVSK